MTSSAADRIEDSNTDQDFKKRARDAADRNEKQTKWIEVTYTVTVLNAVSNCTVWNSCSTN